MKTKQDKRTTETKDKKKERKKKNKKQLSLFVKRDERSGGSFTFEPAMQSPTLVALVACENEFSLTRWHKL